MSIKEKEKQVVEEFELFEDWMDKYNYIIELGKELPGLDESLKEQKQLIRGCQAQVWLHADFQDGRVVFMADSDALITKGIVALLIRVLSGHRPEEILESDLSFIDEIGLKEHLSQTRSNGLVNMIKQMRLYALAFQAQAKGN